METPIEDTKEQSDQQHLAATSASFQGSNESPIDGSTEMIKKHQSHHDDVNTECDVDVDNNDDEDIGAWFYDLPTWYRYVYVSAFTIMAIIMGPAIMNWPPLYDMFSWANAYAYLCDPSDPSYELRAHGEIYCDQKDRAIASMLPPSVSARFAFDLFGGIVLDCFGGKITALTGITIEIIGWILIAFSTPYGFNGYKIGLIMTAAGADPAYFGILSVANLFPGWSSTIMSILGAARSVAFANGLVLREIWRSQREGLSLRGVSLGFAGLLVLCFVFTLFFVPFQTYPKLAPGQQLNTKVKEGKIGYRERLNRKPRVDFKLFKTEAKIQIAGFLKHALTLPYLVFCLVPVCAFVRNSYYSVSYKKHLPNATNFYTVINPLSMLPCPFIGIFADRVSTSFTVSLVALCGAIGMALVMFGNVVALEYISALFNFVFISYIASQFYVYVGYNYPQQQMGKLAGFALLIGGLTALVATPMYDFASRNNNFFPMDLTTVLLGLLSVCIGIYLHWSVERPIRREAKERAQALATTVAPTAISESEDVSHLGQV